VVVGGATTAAQVDATAAPAAVTATDVDVRIMQRIHPPNGRTEVISANKWKQAFARAGNNNSTNRLIDQMYAAGAVNVYIDLFGGSRMPAITGGVGPKMYAELPTDDVKIAACYAAAKAYRGETGQATTAPVDAATRLFLVINLKR
jgi:hypothetical protein